MRSSALFFLVATIVQSLLLGLVLAGAMLALRPDFVPLTFLPFVISMILGALIPMLLFNVLFLIIVARWLPKGDGKPGRLILTGLAYGAVYFLLLTGIEMIFSGPFAAWPGATSTDMIIIYLVTSLACGLIAGEAAERFIIR